uniref:(northern house mosquito) hypothetical protein n=1 Tax=Culex pipiens TaxID=7175 RepID=A0A8D8IJ42_CULPI
MRAVLFDVHEEFAIHARHHAEKLQHARAQERHLQHRGHRRRRQRALARHGRMLERQLLLVGDASQVLALRRIPPKLRPQHERGECSRGWRCRVGIFEQFQGAGRSLRERWE